MERKQPRMGRRSASMLAIPALLLSVSAGLAQPAPPETVVAAPFTPPEDQGEQGDFLLLSWDAVEGADGYRLWREVLVDRVLDEAGNRMELETPEFVLVPWGRVDSVPGAVVRAIVFAGDMGMTRWAVTTLQNTDAGWLESEPRLDSAGAGQALPAPPERVVSAPYTPEGEKGDPGDFLLLSWDAVDGADGYRIWREVLVDRVLDEVGNTIELETPEYVLVPWARVDAVPWEPVVKAIVASGYDDHVTTRWAVTTLQQTEAGQLESEPRYLHVPVEGIGTGVQARSWGDVKQQPRKDAR